jgi:hypothetical protein
MKVGTGRKASLIDAHSQFLVEYVDKYPASILSDIMQNLRESISRIIDIHLCFAHIPGQKCKLRLKKLENPSLQGTVIELLSWEKEKVEEWETMQNLGFTNNVLSVMKQGLSCIPRENLAIF